MNESEARIGLRAAQAALADCHKAVASAKAALNRGEELQRGIRSGLARIASDQAHAVGAYKAALVEWSAGAGHVRDRPLPPELTPEMEAARTRLTAELAGADDAVATLEVELAKVLHREEEAAQRLGEAADGVIAAMAVDIACQVREAERIAAALRAELNSSVERWNTAASGYKVPMLVREVLRDWPPKLPEYPHDRDQVRQWQEFRERLLADPDARLDQVEPADAAAD